MTAPDPRPSPLVPPETDLTSVPSMLLDTRRFLNSDLVTEADAGAAFFAVVLWCEAWHQRPAGSLPASDVSLCKLAGFGRDQSSWKRVQPVAMRGWVLCEDGRYYHPVVCEKALEAWSMHLAYRRRSAAANAKKYGRPFNAREYDEQIARAIEARRLLAVSYGFAVPKDVPPAPQSELPLPPPDNTPPPPAAPPAPSNDPPPPTTRKPRKAKPAPAPTLEDKYGSPAFNRWYDKYPKKAGKKQAWAEWEKQKLDEFEETLTDDVQNRWATCQRWREVQYVPDPERYLKHHRWNDDILPRTGGQRAAMENTNQSAASAWANDRDTNDDGR